MGNFVGIVLPLLLLSAALINWSLLSMVDLLAFLFIQLIVPNIGFCFRSRFLFLWSVIIFSALVLVSEVIFLIVWNVDCGNCGREACWWMNLIGIMRFISWSSPKFLCYIMAQLLTFLVALVEVYELKYGLVSRRRLCSWCFSSCLEHLGSHLRVASCLLLPIIQLIVGICYPSWLSLPFFIGSCVGLVHWSLTSNFLGLFRCWRPLQLYAGFNIVLLYAYQLPIRYSTLVQRIAGFIGLYKISIKSEGVEICSSVSLTIFYMMVSCVSCYLEETDLILATENSSLSEQLLPSPDSIFILESRSSVRHANVLLRGEVFRTLCINFFTYGFPVSLFALFFWSFHFASICAFGLLAYVGYIVYVFPSLLYLHRLNGLLLVFILFWAVGTYIFNLVFVFLDWKLGKDMEIWEMVGLWHYPIPGFFLLAQFCLGVLVAVGNLVNNYVFLFSSVEAGGRSSNKNCSLEVKDDAKVFIVATIAWGLRKCSRAITLTLIVLIALKPGFIHAVYAIFFLFYLLIHDVSKKMRQYLILLCEAHFAVLYLLQFNLISKTLELKGYITMEILSQLGLLDRDSSWDFVEIALLVCFCAMQNHGFEMLFSFSAIVQHTSSPPIGFGILKAGLTKSILLSVYASPTSRDRHNNASHEIRIASFLGAIGQKFLCIYRSCGTYIAFLTILLTVYLVRPNYISVGYFFLLLFWIIGRQVAEKTQRRLWFPLKAYAMVVFIITYSLCNFSSLEHWMSMFVDLYLDLGYNKEASLFENMWSSVAILIVMQLYSYERRQSKHNRSKNADPLESGVVGFFKRLLIWHNQKILFIALFYASLSPVSVFGCLYIVGLVICSIFGNSSRMPSKIFLIYTGFLVTTEYLFQMWGKQADMFPDQKHSDLSMLLGFQVYKPGFQGIESGLRGKVLVIVACTFEYNVFRWLEKIPYTHLNIGKWVKPCPLFISVGDTCTVDLNWVTKPSSDFVSTSTKQAVPMSNSCPSFVTDLPSESRLASSNNWGTEGCNTRTYSLQDIWKNNKEISKCDKKQIRALKRERFEIQKSTLKEYMKFWVENVFNLFSLEINMVALLLASFALLNAISMIYIASLAVCILLNRQITRKFWWVFIFMFSSILILEYFAMWNNILHVAGNLPSKTSMHCHDCWRCTSLQFHYCKNCWLGIVNDDPRTLISYFLVFMLSCFKLHADHFAKFSWSHQLTSQRENLFVWGDLAFETKNMWTSLDHLRLYFYCHLLDFVLVLILITGTLEYDILHLGYLCFALLFFRMRLKILKKKNKVFKFLRIYNFTLIILSLTYQSPFIGNFNDGTCSTIDYIYEVIGFYKYDYGFRITSRSALVEIIIFFLVSLQSYIFSSQEFDHVSQYLEAERTGAIVLQQEKKAAWKTAQLQHIRECEQRKYQRNMQVEKMKTEMLNLQNQLRSMNSAASLFDASPISEGIRKVGTPLNLNRDICVQSDELGMFEKLGQDINLGMDTTNVKSGKPISLEFGKHSIASPICEITEEDAVCGLSFGSNKQGDHAKENPVISAVQLINDGVSQVQSIGNQAVNNLANFLNVSHEESDPNEKSPIGDEMYGEIHNENFSSKYLNGVSFLHYDTSRLLSDAASLQIGRIVRHIWLQLRSHNDIVCYFCFILVFLWNFSLLSVVYLATLFLYALCVNTGPGYIFWVLMLIFTEIYILFQYLYQIIIQHCGLSIKLRFFPELGFPEKKIMSSFVVSTFPLFLVYLVTLMQSFIIASDGEWMYYTEDNFSKKKGVWRNDVTLNISLCEKVWKLVLPVINFMNVILKSFLTYWKSVTMGSESPPYFIQLSMDVFSWPDDGIQPERIESKINQMLKSVHIERCKGKNPNHCPSCSVVRVQSIERSQHDPCVALAVFEVLYASSVIECRPAGFYKPLTPAGDVAKEILEAKHAKFDEAVGFPYPILSVVGGGKREIDLYAYVFGADLTVFFLIAIFYQSVIKSNTQLLEVYQLEDQFPKEFVFILIVIFFLIVLDRIIYLCSFATGKVLFYLFNLILYTYYITKYAWHIRPSHDHIGLLALRVIYLTKTISLALQAIQIRYGVPHKSSLYEQFLTSNISRVNYIGYRIYRALPFLYELRCVLDWSCTNTSLTMYDWLKLEDIFASLYLVKCDAVLNRAQHKHGEKQTRLTKFLNGICLFFVLICIIWAPMLMYSSGNPTNIANPINDISFQVDIKTSLGGKLTLFQTSLCERLQWENLDPGVDLDPQGFLDSYDKTDVQLICCQSDANTYWLVPDVVLKRFIHSLGQDRSIVFSLVLNRERPKGKENVRYERIIDPRDLPKAYEIQNVLNGTANKFRIYNVYPRFVRVTGSGDIRPIDQWENLVSADLVINRGNHEWWAFHDINSTKENGCGDLSGPMAVIVSEETPQGILGETLSKFSIWGLYITFVLAVGRFIRLQCSDLRMRIPYENLPSCDRLIAICEDIYAARAEGELGVEEGLYWTLIKIYRSPHMLLQYTKLD